jgi:NADH:ubiquinone oxidoreductase subunit E
VTRGSGRRLDEVTAALRLAEGRRRYEVIERLVQDQRGPLPADEVQNAASLLGVSLRTLYRLIRLYRMYGTVDALQPRPDPDRPCRADPCAMHGGGIAAPAPAHNPSALYGDAEQVSPPRLNRQHERALSL